MAPFRASPVVRRSPDTGTDRHGRYPLDLVALVAAAILMTIPFLVLHHVNTIDGPGHVFGGRVIGSFRDLPAVRHYYDTSFVAVPNLLTPYLLALFMTVVSPTWAEKLLVAGYIIGFAGAVRFAVRSVNPSAGWLALVALPFVVNYTFLYGFYDFSYGMIGALVAIGLALRGRGRWNAGRVAGVAAVLVLTYASHIVPLVMAVAIIATMAAVDGVCAWRERGAQARIGTVLRATVLPPVLALCPAVVLTAAYVASGQGGALAMARKSWSSLVAGLATLTLPIASYTDVEVVVSVLTALVLVVLAVAAVRAGRATSVSSTTLALAAVVMVCTAVYFASPDVIGTGSSLNDRLSLFPPLMVLLFCASLPQSRRLWRGAAVVALVGTLVMAGARLPTQQRYDRLVDEYLSAGRVLPPGATLVALRYSVQSPPIGDRRYRQLDPLFNEASRIAADRTDIDLRHLEGMFGYFTDRFRPRVKTLVERYLDNFALPPDVDLSGYAHGAGPIDYVLIVGLDRAPAKVRDDPVTRGVQRQLAADYVRVLTTAPTGLVEVYRLRHP